MKTLVKDLAESGLEISEDAVVNIPSHVYVAAQPPDDIAFLMPLPGGKYAKLVLDAHELEGVLDTAHTKLIEAAADEHEAKTEARAETEAPAPAPAEESGATPTEEQSGE